MSESEGRSIVAMERLPYRHASRYAHKSVEWRLEAKMTFDAKNNRAEKGQATLQELVDKLIREEGLSKEEATERAIRELRDNPRGDYRAG